MSRQPREGTHHGAATTKLEKKEPRAISASRCGVSSGTSPAGTSSSEAYDGRAEQIVTQEGYDVLISDNRYFDVLPPSVSKGPSLKRLLQHLDIGDETVLVAGDTLNDLSLFETGLRGVAVSNSEPALMERLGPIASAYKASLPGAGGIAEAIGHYKFAEQLEAIN